MFQNTFINTSSNSWKDTDINTWEISYTSVRVRTFLDEPWVLELEPMLLVMEEPLPISTDFSNNWILIYGTQLGATFVQPYGDTPQIINAFNEYYGDTSILIPRYVLPYGDPRRVVADQVLLWDVYSDLFSSFEELYSVTEFGLVSAIEERYDLKDRNFILSSKELPYFLLDEGTEVSSPVTPIIIYPGSGTVDPIINPGEPGYPAAVPLDFVSVNIDASLGQYCIACDIVLPNADQYLQCQYLDNMTVTMGGTEFSFFIESRERSVSNAAVSYNIGLLSPTAKLDAPYSKTIVDNLNDGVMAKALVERMAAMQDITVDWQIIVNGTAFDWKIPGYAISINDETPLAVIRKVVNAVGGIIQTKPNGDMLIISKYPFAVPSWAGLTPTVTYSTQNDILSLSETLKVNSGNNAFQITDQGSSSESITLEVIDINGLTKSVRGYRVPFDDGPFSLETSGNPGITVNKHIYAREPIIPMQPDDPDWDDESMIVGEDDWEVVEFINHTGTTSKPIYNVIDSVWITEPLGAFQISEDGTLTITNPDAVPGESLLRIKYRTKYWEWTVSGPTDRPVQFYVPELDEVE